MKAGAENRSFAWQPLTPRGVGAFADASFGRLFLVQLICALIAAGAVVWFFQSAWFPAIRQAIRAMPDHGVIRSGKLDWQGESPQQLAEGRFISIAVDLKHEGQTRSPAHLQFEFGQTDLKVISLFGFAPRPYPTDWIIFFNRTDLQPWWGAWSPPILAITAAVVVVGLFVIWTCLASIYFLPVWLISFFANRDLSLGASWRVSGAALMPGALFQVVAIIFYGLGALDLLRLVMAVALHFIVGFIYLVLAPLSLPKTPTLASLKPNPFTPEPGKSQ